MSSGPPLPLVLKGASKASQRMAEGLPVKTAQYKCLRALSTHDPALTMDVIKSIGTAFRNYQETTIYVVNFRPQILTAQLCLLAKPALTIKTKKDRQSYFRDLKYRE